MTPSCGRWSLELERLYNHVTDLGALCNDVGLGIPNAHAQRIREQLLRINARSPGTGCCAAPSAPAARPARLPDPTELHAIAADLAEVVDLALATAWSVTGSPAPPSSPPSRPRPRHASATSPGPAA